MKRFYIFLTSIIFLLSSCNTENPNSNDLERNESIDDFKSQEENISSSKLIANINATNPKNGDEGTSFFYNDSDKIEYIYGSIGCSGLLRYIEYDNTDKISVVYSGDVGTNFNPDTFDKGLFVVNAEKIIFEYENNLLVKTYKSDEINSYKLYSYNSNNTLDKCTVYYSDIFHHTLQFSYSNDVLSSIASVNENSTVGLLYTFELDDNVNPVSSLFENTLFSFNMECRYASINGEMDGMHFPHNVEKLYRNNKLVYSAIFEYDDMGYPTEVIYTQENGLGESLTIEEEITYK